MAFLANNLSAMAHGNGQTWWQYKNTADAKTTIDTVGYFNDAAPMLKVHDLMFVIASDGYGWFAVNANDGAIVDLTDATSLVTTDTR